MNESKIEVFDLTFNNLSLNEATDQVLLLASKNEFNYVVTPNVDHIVRINQIPELKVIYKNAKLCFNDSRILFKMAAILGLNFVEVVPGSSLTRKIFESISTTNLSIAIIGGSRSDITMINRLYDIEEISHYNPPMGFINDEFEVQKCINFVKSAKADLIFLAVGSPRQEVLAEKLSVSCVRGVALCIGASILFLTGKERRAPLWCQKLNMEWFYRFIQNPQRLYRRYFISGLRIVPLFISEIMLNIKSKKIRSNELNK